MTGSERRTKILEKLTNSDAPIAARSLAKEFGVSRQIIVSDIALLRAEKHDIASTNKGYLLFAEQKVERVFKVIHDDEQVEDELNQIVDLGGVVEDVFVYHKTYGTIKAEMNIHSRKEVQDFVAAIATGKSSLLKNVTAGYHYHTVSAPTEMLLELIQKKLDERGYLAPLQDYEPVDFWSKEEA